MNAAEENKASDEIEIDLFAELQLFKQLIRKNWLWIAILSLLGAGTGYYYVSKQKPQYTAKYQFSVKLSEMSGAGAMSGLASLIGGGGGGADPYAKIIALAGSEKIIGKALYNVTEVGGKKEMLINHFIQLEGLPQKWSKDSTLQHVKFKPVLYSLERLNYGQRKALFSILGQVVGGEDATAQGVLAREYDKKTGLINLTVTHWNEEFAIALSRSIYQELIDFYIYDSFDNMSLNVRNVKNKLDSIRHALYSTQLAAAKKSDQALGLIMREDQVEQKSLNIKEQMLIAMLGEAQKNYETLTMMQRSSKPDFTLIREPFSPITPKLKSKLLFSIGPFFFIAFGSIVLLRLRLLMKSFLSPKKTHE
ncbi:hypothetical protein [Aquirufa antheringensis]|uniref:hypothetical protein n=1 Tax=Aquirufa antheringensis TaxID=2516559 RepID=UPI0022A96001|nr:hypothetical protein [Aquirufa antheringensis]MCZ2490103.1 hypothetical protein [Aquirufa antheringensis]